MSSVAINLKPLFEAAMKNHWTILSNEMKKYEGMTRWIVKLCWKHSGVVDNILLPWDSFRIYHWIHCNKCDQVFLSYNSFFKKKIPLAFVFHSLEAKLFFSCNGRTFSHLHYLSSPCTRIPHSIAPTHSQILFLISVCLSAKPIDLSLLTLHSTGRSDFGTCELCTPGAVTKESKKKNDKNMDHISWKLGSDTNL